ncbi:hypothetical protein [Rathayibacter sp. AY1C2]|uniref:hypothetical protein n=1 Tax=Rathayibacter sp. AY1C2 TaxID=2080535 RepID=UPI0011B01BA0|nr:hypothetical protein [Rathayibacter sp. AY1C2]
MAQKDTRETDSQARLGLKILQRQFRRYEQVAARTDELDVANGSSLSGDRNAASYNPVPDLIRNNLGVALDHLHALLVSVEESGGKILAMSSFTLIRTAYEATATGLWILHPASRDERLLRSMQLTYENRRLVRSMKTGTTKPGEAVADPGFDRTLNRLREQIATRPGLAARDPKTLTSLAPVTARLEYAAESVPDLPLPPLTLWQMASGIAHGNQSMMIALLEREKVGDSDQTSSDYNVTSSVVSIALFYTAALDMIDVLIELYDSRNIPI